MKWRVGERRLLHASHWAVVELAEVGLPDGSVLQHEILTMPRECAMTAVVRDGSVLMLFRHRFLNDAWGWELPGGMVDSGELPIEAAAREVEEETGWRPTGIRHLTSYRPSSGWSVQRFHLFAADDAEYMGLPTEQNEATHVAWRPLDEVRTSLQRGESPDGLTQFTLAFVLAAAGGAPIVGPGAWGDQGAPDPTAERGAPP